MTTQSIVRRATRWPEPGPKRQGFCSTPIFLGGAHMARLAMCASKSKRRLRTWERTSGPRPLLDGDSGRRPEAGSHIKNVQTPGFPFPRERPVSRHEHLALAGLENVEALDFGESGNPG